MVLGIGAISALSLIPYLATIEKAQEVLVIAQGYYPWRFLFRRLQWAVGLESQLLLWSWVVCAGLCILICGYFIVYKRNDPEHEDTVDLCIFNLTVMAFGTALFFAFLKSTALATGPWYFMILMGVIALSLDVGLEQAATTFRRRMVRLVAAGVVAGMMVPIAWTIVPERFTNLDVIASAMEERASEEDLIILNPYWYGITFQHYYRGKAKWITVPPIEDLKINRFDLLKERMSSVDSLRPVWEEIERSLRSGNRVWVIGKVDLPPEEQLPSILPPAPHSRAGWRLDAYVASWTVQLEQFLDSHWVESQEAPFEILDESRFSPDLEAPMVQVGKGWR